MKKIAGWLLVMIQISQIVFAQNNISVDKFTGTASATIPIHTINVDGYQYPIALQYASGLQLNDKGSNVGVGWYLQAEGSITRNMRGLPDDYNLDPENTDDNRRGWLFSTIGSDVHNFTPASDGNLTTCTDDNPVYNNLNNLGLNKDTEPDIFHIQVPGISGSFIFDKDGNIQLLNYQNVRIEEVRHHTDLYITGFYIYNEEGVRFGFTDMETTYMNTTGQTPPNYFLRDFRLANTEFSFVSKWSLTSIQFPSGKNISFQYDPVYKYYAQDLEYDIYAREIASGYKGDTLFTMHKIYKSREFDKIVYGNTEIYFNNYPTRVDKISILDNTYNTGELVKETYLNYKYINTRYFLTSVHEQHGCARSNPYKFDYYGMTSLSANTSNKKDYWGFYNASSETAYPQIYVYPDLSNGQRYRINPIPGYAGTSYTLAGRDGTTNPNVIHYGSLKKLTYPTGGYTQIVYEPHTYYDATAGTTITGGGIRAKILAVYDGFDADNPLITEFTYPVNGGKVKNVPQYAFPIAVYRSGATTYRVGDKTGLERWEFFTYRTKKDLLSGSNYDGQYVIYDQVEEIVPGKGKTVYYFSTPATFAQTSQSDWSASYSYIARKSIGSGCTTIGLLDEGYYTYPYPVNTNYSFERGNIDKVEMYNETGNKVKEITYNYTRVPGRTALFTYGVNFQIMNGDQEIFNYSKYKLLTNQSKVLTEKRVKTYDPTNWSQSIEDLSTLNYNSNATLGSMVTKDSEDNEYTLTLKYANQYSLGTINDDYTQSLKNMVTRNMLGIPIETIWQKKIGATNYVIKSGISFYQTVDASYDANNNMLNGKIYPIQNATLKINGGITNFQNSSISSGNFSYDSRYEVDQKTIDYNEKGNLLHAKDLKKHIGGTHYGHNQLVPVLSIANADYNEVVFTNFETPTTNNLKFISGLYDEPTERTGKLVAGRTGKNAYSLPLVDPLGQTFYKRKSTTTKYIFSCWINGNGSSGNLYVKLNSTSNNPILTLSYSGSTWTYHQRVIDVTVSNGNHQLLVECSGQGMIDDILFYPEYATISHSNFDKYGLTSETGNNGITTFYEYDQLGRLLYLRDFDNNILQKTTYNYLDNVSMTTEILIEGGMLDMSKNIVYRAQTNLQFSGSDFLDCLTGVTYSWNFGDGTSSTQAKPTHSYSADGTYMVSLTVSHPTYGDFTQEQQLIIETPPLTASIVTTHPLVIFYEYDLDAGEYLYYYFNDDSGQFELTMSASIGFEAMPEGGSGFYNYSWYISFDSGSTWSYISNAKNIARNEGINTYHIKCTVTSGGQQVSEVVQRITVQKPSNS